MKAKIDYYSTMYTQSWLLILTENEISKTFYLGEDRKVCHRMLGIEPINLINEIGGNNISDDAINQNLTNMVLDSICNSYNITPKDLFEMEPWAVSVE